MSLGRFARLRGSSSFARSTNFPFLTTNGGMTRRLYFVISERPILTGFAEQRSGGTTLASGEGGGLEGAGGVPGGGGVEKTEKVQEALMVCLANLDMTLLQSSVCGILPTHSWIGSMDYMKADA